MNNFLSFLGSDQAKIAVGVISTFVGIFLTIAKIKSIIPRPRLYLKEDIEIRNSLDSDEEEHRIVSDYIKSRIHEIYANRGRTTRSSFAGSKILTIAGIAMSFSGIYLTYAVHEAEKWSSWWYIGTIYLVFLGIGVISIQSRGNRNQDVVENKPNK